MTNDEAIKILSENPVAYPDPDAQSIWDEAMDMAISALEAHDGKKKTNIKRLPCTCGRKRLETWWSWDNDSWYLKCPVCGKKSSPVKKKSDLNTAWNNAVRGDEHGAD